MAKQKADQQPHNPTMERLQGIAVATERTAKVRADAEAARRDARAKLAAWLVAQGAPADAVEVLFPA